MLSRKTIKKWQKLGFQAYETYNGASIKDNHDVDYVLEFDKTKSIMYGELKNPSLALLKLCARTLSELNGYDDYNNG